jgi:hypothetical protein
VKRKASILNKKRKRARGFMFGKKVIQNAFSDPKGKAARMYYLLKYGWTLVLSALSSGEFRPEAVRPLPTVPLTFNEMLFVQFLRAHSLRAAKKDTKRIHLPSPEYKELQNFFKRLRRGVYSSYKLGMYMNFSKAITRLPRIGNKHFPFVKKLYKYKMRLQHIRGKVRFYVPRRISKSTMRIIRQFKRREKRKRAYLKMLKVLKPRAVRPTKVSIKKVKREETISNEAKVL